MEAILRIAGAEESPTIGGLTFRAETLSQVWVNGWDAVFDKSSSSAAALLTDGRLVQVLSLSDGPISGADHSKVVVTQGFQLWFRLFLTVDSLLGKCSKQRRRRRISWRMVLMKIARRSRPPHSKRRQPRRRAAAGTTASCGSRARDCSPKARKALISTSAVEYFRFDGNDVRIWKLAVVQSDRHKTAPAEPSRCSRSRKTSAL